MKGPVKFVAVAAVVLVSSAVLAPLLYDLLPYPFPRIFTRLLMIGAMLAAVIFVRIRKNTFARYGMARTPDTVRFLVTGFLTGVAGLVAFALVSVAIGHAHVVIRQLSALGWAERLAEALLTGILAGVLEEFLFRGFLFAYIRDRLFKGHVLPGMVVTSLLYASLHFLTVGTPVISPDPGIADSVNLMLAPLQSLTHWPVLWPSAVGLFLFGMVLNACVIRTGSLYPAIGLHAGCVAFLRAVGLFLAFGKDDVLLWSSKRVYDGAMGWAFLLFIGLLLVARLKRAVPST